MPMRSALVCLCVQVGLLALPGCVAPPIHYPFGGTTAAQSTVKPQYVVLHSERQHSLAARKYPVQSVEAESLADETGLTPGQKLSLFKNFVGQQKSASDSE